MKLFSKKNKVKSDNSNGDILHGIKSIYDLFLRNYTNYGLTSNYEISIPNAINLYQQCSPFFMVVDKIATSYSEIPFTLYDKSKETFVDSHEVLDLLNNPNSFTTGISLKEQIASNFLITGNYFLMATGDYRKPPLELLSLQPQYFNAISNNNSFLGFLPRIWQYNSNREIINFNAIEDSNGIHFLNSDDRELFHSKRFNPTANIYDFYGMSKAYPLFREMESYTAGNINNSALLKNGARPSVAWVNNRGEELTQSQYERIVEEARKFSGSDNAGGTPILDGMDIKEIGQSNRDMQFKELQDTMLSRIANVYGVPLALLLDSTMTLNNLQTARLHLDKDAIIPLAKKINDDFNKFLLPRYADSENLEFRLDISLIESLKPEVLNNALLMKQIGVNTINDIRNELGYINIDGGDILTNQITSTSENPYSDIDSDIEDQEKSYSYFYNLMKKDKNLTDEELKALWVLSKSK